MFPVNNKKTYSFIFLKAIYLLCLLFFLTSCGDDSCYYDIQIQENGDSYNVRSKSLEISSLDEDKDTGIIIDYNDDSATIAVGGAVFMCGNNASSKLASGCTLGNGGYSKYICSQDVTEDNFRDTWGSCFIPSQLVQSGTKVCKGEGFCTPNGILYNWDRIPKLGAVELRVENSGLCDNQGTQEFGCDSDGNETIIFKTIEASTPPKKTGKKCISNDLRNYIVGVSAQTKQWTEIGKDIHPGDIINFIINPPSYDSPNVLSGQKNYYYQDTDKTIINRWVQNRNQYAELIPSRDPSCPLILQYDAEGDSIDKLTSRYQTCAPLKILPYWNAYGKGLFLKAVEGECPSDSQCSGVEFNSTNEEFGTLLKVPGENGRDSFARSFVSNKKYNKICAKICDTRTDEGYEDNIGGYNISVSKEGCVARNGNPSSCCGDFRGGLEYKIGSGNWIRVDHKPDSNDNKIVFPIKNNKTSGKLYVRINNGTKTTRLDNAGEYSLTIFYREYASTTTISGVIEWLKRQLRNMFFSGQPSKPGLLEKYFNKLSGNKPYIQYIRALLLLYIVLYGLAFLIGYVKISQKDLILRVLKIGVVVTFIQKKSYDFLYNNFFKLFIEGSESLIKLSNFANHKPDGNTFAFLDDVLAILLFNEATWLKILSVIGSSSIGLILVVLLLVALVHFLIGVMTAVISYFMCILSVSILIFISPIFIPFILFKNTYKLFKNWLQLLVRYALEPVLLVIGLQVLVAIFYAVLKGIINFTVCWKCMFPINFGAISAINSFLTTIGTTTKVFCIPFLGPFGYYGESGSLFGGLSVYLPNIILLVIISHLIKDYHSFISKMLDNIVSARPEVFSGGSGGFVKNKLGNIGFRGWTLGALEKKLTIRNGIERLTGIKFRTEKEVYKDEEKSNEKAKVKGLLHLGYDVDAEKFSSISSNLASDRELTDKLRGGGEEREKAASKLGMKMFNVLSQNETANRGFIDGMKSLRKMDEKTVDDLVKKNPNLSSLKEIHKVLNSSNAEGLLDAKAPKGSMQKLGKELFMNEEVSRALLDGKTNSELSGKIFELGRESRGGIK
jgi:type IV secretory pathway VirB6-like protein